MQLLKWLSVTDRFYKIYLDKQLAPYGINNSQYMFLIKICRSPGILQDSLLNMFYVHPSNIVRTVATLEKQGMITRSPNDKDKRTCKLYPTERALSIIDEIQMICEKTEALLLQGMSESEQNLFMDFLIQAGRNINIIHFTHVRFNVSGGHSFGIHGKYFFFHVLSYSNRTAKGRKSA